MNIIGAIQAYREADKIGGAVSSAFAAGCDRVVVLDGAWSLPDGSYFGGGPHLSDDGTREAALAAGAEFVIPTSPMFGDGGKRDRLVCSLSAGKGDRVFILDADERVQGTLDRDNLPPAHAVVILRNLRENDLPGIRGTWPHGDYGPVVPLIRWLVWSKHLRCDGPGRYRDESGPIEPYLTGQLRRLLEKSDWPSPITRAARVIYELGEYMTPEQACAIPILEGVEIHHIIQASEDRVAAKRSYYEALQ